MLTSLPNTFWIFIITQKKVGIVLSCYFNSICSFECLRLWAACSRNSALHIYRGNSGLAKLRTLGCYHNIFLWLNHCLPFDLLKDSHMNAIASASIFSVLKISALILPFSPLSHVCLWDIAVALAAQLLIKLSHLKAFILSFSFSSNKKAKIHFQSLNWNLMRFWRCYYLEGNQLWGKSWGFLRYFQWHPRVWAVFSCSFLLIWQKWNKHQRNTEQKTQKWTTKAYWNLPGIFWSTNPPRKVDFFSRGSDF